MNLTDNEQLKQTFIQIEREATTESFYEFFLSFWSTIVQEELKDNWHIKYLCDELQYLSKFIIERKKKPYDLVINVPPGSTKTTIVLQMYPAWIWAIDPSIRIISSSHGHDLSENSANKSKDIITSKRYQALFPHVRLRRDSKAKSKYATTAGGNRHTTSTNGSATGDHAHLKLMDDLQDITKSASKANREAAISHMKMLFTREVEKDNSINILIMQRLHELDCTAYILSLSNRKVKHICLPAEESDAIKPPELRKHYINGLLDPIRMSDEILAHKKQELGTYGYNSQFQQEATPPEGGIIKRNWFAILEKELFVSRHESPVHFFIDTAYEKKKNVNKKTKEAKNDPTGLLACSFIKGIVYIYDYREVYMELPDLCKFIPKWARSYGYTSRSTIRIEPKASGKSTAQTIRQFTSLNVVEILDANTKDSKETELTNAAPAIEAGRVTLLEGQWNVDFLDRICGFPNAAHDEAVDLLCYAKKFFLGDDNSALVDDAFEKAMKLLS